MLEELIKNAAPTLAKIKSANLFNYKFDDKKDLKFHINHLNMLLSKKGLKINLLRCRNKSALIYIFNREKLSKELKNNDALFILKKYGYKNNNINNCINKLSKKINLDKDFPHEIGIFLGFPPIDVKLFILNKGCNYKCLGCWKAYFNVEETQKTFELYKNITQEYVFKYKNGINLNSIICIN